MLPAANPLTNFSPRRIGSKVNNETEKKPCWHGKTGRREEDLPGQKSPPSRLPVFLCKSLGSVFLSALLFSCSKSPSSAPAAQANGDRRFPLTGEVLSIDTAKRTARVRHDAVGDFMPAMTMDFGVSTADADALKTGERIRADLVAPKDGEFRLENIWPNDQVSADVVAAAARQLREDTHNRGSGAYREIGETVPNFALYDQDARVVQSSRFHGKQIMVNFIFTRCPDPRMCPTSTNKMMQTQKLAREAAVTNLELVSITLDPANDTPAVLRQYAAVRNIDTSNFSFLTGPESAIRDLLAQFGVIAEFKGDILTHTLSTLLIDENGKIIYRADGSQWDPKEFVGRMHRA